MVERRRKDRPVTAEQRKKIRQALAVLNRHDKTAQALAARKAERDRVVGELARLEPRLAPPQIARLLDSRISSSAVIKARDTT